MTCQMPMLLPRMLEVLMGIPIKWFRLFRSSIVCFIWGIEHGKRTLFAGPIFIRTRRRNSVRIGDDVRFNSTVKENALCRGPSVLDTRLGGIISIGDGTGASSAVLSCKSSITIGKRCLIGANVQIYDHNFHAAKAEDRRNSSGRANIKTAPVIVEDECFIGANAMILKGTRIGARSIVAAGSVVFGLDVPPDSLVRGNPAVVEERIS